MSSAAKSAPIHKFFLALRVDAALEDFYGPPRLVSREELDVCADWCDEQGMAEEAAEMRSKPGFDFSGNLRLYFGGRLDGRIERFVSGRDMFRLPFPILDQAQERRSYLQEDVPYRATYHEETYAYHTIRVLHNAAGLANPNWQADIQDVGVYVHEGHSLDAVCAAFEDYFGEHVTS